MAENIGPPLPDVRLFLFWIFAVAGLTFIGAAFTPREPMIDQGDRLQLRAGSDGHYHLDGTVGNQPVNFLVDTGASSVAFPDSIRFAMGIAQCDAIVKSRTANGVVAGCGVDLDEITVGPYRLENIRVLFLPHLSEPLLGMNALQRFRISQQQDVLSLYPVSRPGITITRFSSTPPQRKNQALLAGIGLLLACVYLAIGIFRPKRLTPRRGGTHPTTSPDPLLRACFGDRAKMNRLIEYELRRAPPGLTGAEIKQRALERLERDRG